MVIQVTQPTPGEPPLAIEVTGLPWTRTGGVSAIVQRSTDGGVRWTTVRGLADVPVPPPPGLHLTGFDGDYASTPDTASLDITGDIDIRVDLTAGALGGNAVAKATYGEATEVSFDFYVDPELGVAYLEWSPDGESVLWSESDPVPSLVSRQRGTIRVTLDVAENGHHVIAWYTGPTVDGPWTPLGEPQVVAGTTAIYASAQPLTVGALSDGYAAMSGVVHAVKILDGVDGTPVVDVRFDEQPSGTPEFEDATGLGWTVHGDAEILVEPPIVAKDWEFRPGVTNQYRVGTHQIVDTYSRYTADGWGTSDTGQTWDTGDIPEGYAYVTGESGTIYIEPADTKYLVTIQEPDDLATVDVAVTVSGMPVPTGANIMCGLVCRYVDDNQYLSLRVAIEPDGEVHIGGVITFPDGQNGFGQSVTPIAYTGSERLRIRMRVRTGRFQGKVWLIDDEPEPEWQVDTGIAAADFVAAAGRIGIEVGTGPGFPGVEFLFDDFVADIDQPQWIGGAASITPTLAQPWLCSTMRSFLSRPITIRSYEEPSRAARGGLTPIAHRTLPIAQVELSGGREWPLEVRAADLAEARAIEWIAASGDVLWLLVPAGSPIPGGYYRVGQIDARHHRQQGPTRWLTLPLTEVAAPGPDIVTAQSTWDTVIAQYGTWADVIAAVPTWEALLELVGDPSEVVVDD